MSTGSTAVEVRDEEGAVVARGVAEHDGRVPSSWWTAFEDGLVAAGVTTSNITSLRVASGPGVVILDRGGDAVWAAHPGDIDAGPDAGWLLQKVPGGATGWRSAVGFVPDADAAVSALSWVHHSEPEVWACLAHVVSPADWLTRRLTGTLVTTSGRAATTGYWSPTEQRYRLDVLAVIDGDRDWTDALPTVVDTGRPVGTWCGITVVAG